MNARRISSAFILTAVMWCTSELTARSVRRRACVRIVFGCGGVARAAVPGRRAGAAVPVLDPRSRTSATDASRGAEAADGTIGYELLVGSDPARTPRQINRWGYLREESGRQWRHRVRRDEPVRRAVRGGRRQEYEPDRWHPRLQGPATVADRIAGAGHRLRCPRAERPDLRGSRRALVGGACRAVHDENRGDAPVDLTGLSGGHGQPDGRRTHGGGQSIESPALRPHLSLQRSALRPAVAIRGPRGPAHARGTVVRSSDSRTDSAW